MPNDFLPSKEADLVNWSSVFDARINLSAPALGLSNSQVTGYTVLHDAFVSAFDLTQANSTRTPSAIVTKDDAKAALKENARLLAGVIQKNPTTTDTQRSDLGLTVPDPEPSPVPVPSEPPQLDVIERFAKTVRIRLHDPANPTKRGKPEDVRGATVFSFVGATPPANIKDWNFEGNITRTVFDVEFPVTVPPGTQVWLTAFWRNPRDQAGPACEPVTTYLASGMSQAA